MILIDGPTMQNKMSAEAGTAHPSSCGGRTGSPNFDIQYSQQYAVQVALVTMKERCQKLQERLISLERENAALKASAASSCGNSSPSRSTGASDVEAKLRDKVVQLQSQKSHLTHQIFIVASENKKLFDRLSRLTEANRSLGSHLSRISNTLSRHEQSASVDQTAAASTGLAEQAQTHPTQSSTSRSLSPSDLSSVSLRPEPEGARTSGEQGTKEESLEEISSKLIQSILQAKADLQSQYEQMVELQSDQSDDGVACDGTASHVAVRDLGFCYQPHKTITEDTVEEAEEEVRVMSEKLSAARDMLRQQQLQIRALLTAYTSRKVRCKECEERHREESELDSLKLWGSGEEPMSSATMGVRGPPEQADETHDVPEARPTRGAHKTGACAPEREISGHTTSRSTQCSEDDLVAPQTERELPEGESVPCEKLCPLCSKVFGVEVPFEEFQNHVMSHFPDTDEDDESTFCSIV